MVFVQGGKKSSSMQKVEKSRLLYKKRKKVAFHAKGGKKSRSIGKAEKSPDFEKKPRLGRKVALTRNMP